MTFWQFAGDHPILTFFLAVIIGETLVGIAKAFRKEQ
jgi:hypothetical protein